MDEPASWPDDLSVHWQSQHSVLRSLGEVIRKGGGLAALLDRAPALLTRALGVEFCEIVEYAPGRRYLVLRGKAGWRGDAFAAFDTRIEAGVGSFAGFTLISRRPVTFENLMEENRFRPYQALVDHQV